MANILCWLGLHAWRKASRVGLRCCLRCGLAQKKNKYGWYNIN